ncbi:hypothetical protein L1887_18327 [Cichorium endivia]|nr:hypothetical protein L1887_18327 [Cichorium endivia]
MLPTPTQTSNTNRTIIINLESSIRTPTKTKCQKQYSIQRQSEKSETEQSLKQKEKPSLDCIVMLTVLGSRTQVNNNRWHKHMELNLESALGSNSVKSVDDEYVEITFDIRDDHMTVYNVKPADRAVVKDLGFGLSVLNVPNSEELKWLALISNNNKIE